MKSADPLCTRVRINLEPRTPLAGMQKDALPLVEPGDALPEAVGKGALAAGAVAVDDVGRREERAVRVATAVDGDLTHSGCLLVVVCG